MIVVHTKLYSVVTFTSFVNSINSDQKISCHVKDDWWYNIAKFNPGYVYGKVLFPNISLFSPDKSKDRRAKTTTFGISLIQRMGTVKWFEIIYLKVSFLS